MTASPAVARPYQRLLVFAAILFLASSGNADTVLGVPVTGFGSTEQAVPTCPTLEGNVCFDATTGWTKFYIPLSSDADGVFGVTDIGSGRTAGTVVDSGYGISNALTMYLRFAPVNLPAASASLTFTFTDLDLSGVNDPYGFFESVRFFTPAGAITPLITANGQSGGGALPFTVTGDSTSQSIIFSDVLSILQNPLYVKLKFNSDWYTKGKNTPEYLKGELKVTSSIPEPATLLLLGGGLAAVGTQWKRFGATSRKRNSRNPL
ncbi:MAG: PEP-CTERM sorting domain-containing protein [Candidatus Korobacteraceae bacterium]